MRRIVLTTLLTGWMANAYAIVNIESLRSGEPPQGYSGAFNLSVDGQSGNTDKVGGNAGARLQWHGGVITNFVLLRYAYGETSGIQDNFSRTPATSGKSLPRLPMKSSSRQSAIPSPG